MRKILFVLLFTVSFMAAAQERTVTVEKKSEPQQKEKKDPPVDQISTTQHTIRVGDETIRYTARAGTIVLKNDDGEPRASFFHVAYTKDGADPATRPVTFTFNGGPGSSSVWLHMGAFGPKRVAYKDDEGHAASPPYRTVDNEGTILDVTDLVFIDPVTTGFSRAIPFSDAKKFHGFEADVESVGEFIRLWTTRNARWSSPKFLAGESYGTTRAAGLAGWLQDQGYYLNGVMLISSILNFGTARFDSGNDLAVHPLPADVHGHGLVPQAPSRGSAERHARARGRGVGALRPRRIHDGADERRPRDRRGAAQRRREARAAAPASRRATSSRRTCASASSASTRSCCATSAAPSAASTRASSASTATPPARSRRTTRRTPRSSASTRR